jgi:cyclopropane-fatty-acyl-phospholipid synthase
MELTKRDRFSNLPNGERYLYELFSLIETGNLTVTNPQGKVFHFGEADAEEPLHLNIHNANTYNRILTLKLCVGR